MNSVYERLLDQNQGIDKELLRTRFKLMAVDAFAFYRGACGLFYEDLHASGVDRLPYSPLTWISGDLHLANFGTYRGSTGLIYFDINDFDESVLAPALWELSRLAASVVVSGKCRAMNDSDARKAARECLEVYAQTLVSGKAMYVESNLPEEGEVGRVLKKAAGETMKELLEKETTAGKGQREFKTGGKNADNIEVKDKDKRQALMKHLEGWIQDGELLNLKQYKVADVVFRVSGTGSVGRDRYMFLLHWPHEGSHDCLILEMKEAGPSSIVPFVSKIASQPIWESPARRVVQVQTRMQAVCPPVLDSTLFQGKSYLVQQRQPEKKKIDFTDLDEKDTLRAIDCMARVTAYAQLRSAGRDSSATADALVAFGKNSGAWLSNTLQYAQEYADVTMKYYKDFRAEVDS